MFGYHEMFLDGVPCQVWDTAGSEKHGSLMPMYLRGADVAIICFDLSSKNALHGVTCWIGIVTTHSPDIKMIVVGTKADLCADSADVIKKLSEGLAPLELGAHLANICHACSATSARTGQGVSDLFDHIKDHLRPLTH